MKIEHLVASFCNLA